MYTQVHVPVTGGWNHNSLTDNYYSAFFYIILSLYLLPFPSHLQPKMGDNWLSEFEKVHVQSVL